MQGSSCRTRRKVLSSSACKLEERTCEKSAAARAGSSGPVFERCYYYRMLFRVFLYLVR